MTINIQASISSLIESEIATALAIATGNPRLYPLMRSISADISVNFSSYANELITNDLKTNIGSYSDEVGLFNNLNTTINNISAVSLGGLVSQYTSIGMDVRLSGKLITMIHAALIQNTTITLPKIVNITFLERIISPLIAASINNVINEVISNIINNSYDNYSGAVQNEQVLDDLDVTKSTEAVQNAIARQTEAELKKFSPFSEDNSKKLETLKRGFIDPDANYPNKQYKGIADTNKLAQGIISGTIVQKKNADRMVGAKLPDGESFAEPVSAFHARYPYNKVTETLSGHVIEIDDTPSGERIHVWHKTGTYFEIDAEGNLVRRTKGSEFNIIDRNGYTSIHGNGNLSVGGDLKVMVSGNAHVEVTGDAIVNCMNNAEINAAGRLALTAGEAIDMRSPNIYIEADNELHIVADTFCRQDYKKLDLVVNTDFTSRIEGNTDTHIIGNYTKHVDGIIDISGSKNINVLAGADIHVTSTGHQHMKSGSDIVLEAVGTISGHGATVTMNSSGNVNLTASGAINGNSGGVVAFDGSATYLQSGMSSSVANVPVDNPSTAAVPNEAVEAEYSQGGLIESREDFINLDIPDVFPDNFIDDQAYTSDDVNDATTNKAVQDDLVKKGLAKPEDFKDVPVDVESDNEKPVPAIGYIQPDKKLLSLTETPPDNFMISPHFSLGMLSSRAPAQPHKVKEQQGLTIGQIVYNLSEIANNVCEPILALYPNMVVTSGFRLSEASKNNKSVHTMGKAVDMQFTGVPNSEYYNIAKRVKNILNSSDQILLESKSYGSGNSWLHVGFRNSNDEQRNQVATFHNNSKYADGLVQIT